MQAREKCEEIVGVGGCNKKQPLARTSLFNNVAFQQAENSCKRHNIPPLVPE